jgi:hypothetical protein
VTTFVQIEMAWKCPKVESSIKSGLKDLRVARDKCITILRESNDLLRFFDKVSCSIAITEAWFENSRKVIRLLFIL